MLKEFINDFREGLLALQEVRDPFWYLTNHFITPSECLLLERYPEHGVETNAN